MKLSQEICKHPKFTIKRGMRYRYIVNGEPKTRWNTARYDAAWPSPKTEIDLTDGATVGALLYLLRELTRDDWYVYPSSLYGDWRCYCPGDIHSAPTEGEAVAIAFIEEVPRMGVN